MIHTLPRNYYLYQETSKFQTQGCDVQVTESGDLAWTRLELDKGSQKIVFQKNLSPHPHLYLHSLLLQFSVSFFVQT